MKLRRVTPLTQHIKTMWFGVGLFSILLIMDIATEGHSHSGLLLIVGIAHCLRAARVGIYANDEAVRIKNRPWQPASTIGWDSVTEIFWRHNLQAIGKPSKRLWIILDDGQECPTPVTAGAATIGESLSQAQSDAVMAELQERWRAVTLV